MSKKGELTPKQEKFCNEYLVDLNATQAAIRAGYSKKTAQEQSSRLLSNVIIQEFIATKRAKLEVKTEISQEYVLNNLKRIVDRCMQDVIPLLDKKGNEIMVKDESGKLKAAFVFNTQGANKSLELLGKYKGMFVEKKEVVNLTFEQWLAEAQKEDDDPYGV